MSYCKTFGKDTVMFVTKEDHAIPSTVVLPPPEPPQGLISQTGEINWSCPCLGGMATGPCGVQFRDAFSCFHYSEADPKGSDCYDAFRTMQDCFQEYPTVYNKASGSDDDDGNDTNIMDMGSKDEVNEHQEIAVSTESKNESEETPATPAVSTEVEKTSS